MAYTTPKTEGIFINKTVLGKLSYGLYLLAARDGEKDNGCIVNTVVQVANEPCLISVAVAKKTLTGQMIANSGKFNVSIITSDAPFDLFKAFGMTSGRDVDKFSRYPDAARNENGLYYLTRYANAFISATVTQTIDLGSHYIFIAGIDECAVLCDSPSCTYEDYRRDIKASAPIEKHGWVCTVCGYVHEGAEPPEVCPLCKMGKEKFERI